MSGVLAHVALRLARSEELVITEGLAWVLRQSPAATRAVMRWALPGVEDSQWRVSSQVASDLGRPDLVIADAGGATRLVIEGKFDAGLTNQQPDGYLAQLSGTGPRGLMFVAPERRVESLWWEVTRSVPGDFSRPAVAGPHRGSTGGDVALSAVSWAKLLEVVDSALDPVAERDLRADAGQLQALAREMETRVFEPAAPGDYDQRTARLVAQAHLVVDSARAGFTPGAALVKAGNSSSHGRFFYGWYARAARSNKQVWFGVLPRVWARHGRSPLWAQILEADRWPRTRIENALSPLQDHGQPGFVEDGSGVAVPLLIPHHVDLTPAADAVRQQLYRIGELLDANVQPDEPAVATEVAADTGNDEEPTINE